MWNFQRKSQKFRNRTDRYKCTSRAHALHGSLARYSWCQSVLIFPLDQANHPLVRCKSPISGLRGGYFQRQSLKLRYPTDRYKCTSSAHAFYGSQARHPWCQACSSFRWIKQLTNSRPLRNFIWKMWNIFNGVNDGSIKQRPYIFNGVIHHICMGHIVSVKRVLPM